MKTISRLITPPAIMAASVASNKESVWKMAEGNPPQQTEISGELKLPTPILGELKKDE